MSVKKVYAFVRGGLGNQLFIYAAARCVAIKNDASLILLDDSYVGEFHGRSFLLRKFRVDAVVSGLADGSVPYSAKSHKFLKFADRFMHFIGLSPSHYFLERRKRLFKLSADRLDPRFFNIAFKDYIFLDGYFQEERYFLDIKQVIRNELCLAERPSPETEAVADDIQKCNAVCLHFRRTELEAKDVEERRGVSGLGYQQGLDMSFYEKAISSLSKAVKNPRFFGFSDFPEWMMKNVKLSVPVTFVTHNSSADMCHEDLYLMSLCKHHVISHSTFSWWGAWLSGHAEQRVYAPIDRCRRQKSPFYPASWQTIDVCQERVSG